MWAASLIINPSNGIHNKVRKVIGAAYLWTIWKHRNKKIFKGNMKKEKEICREIQFLGFNWIRGRSKFWGGNSQVEGLAGHGLSDWSVRKPQPNPTHLTNRVVIFNPTHEGSCRGSCQGLAGWRVGRGRATRGSPKTPKENSTREETGQEAGKQNQTENQRKQLKPQKAV
ncbi:hypothetical protein OSB04_000511 [Centaurea solstitialis]|uniref:Uncharacterized protein n=1 Tax=Centaurea solstitialis TaxID=347529 RepID=A0AA38WS52_9ASTR|nr:hypothetical protein OSB04_000511 [Centaurea solstitialis]